MIKYTLTNDNVTVVVDGKLATFQAGTVNFNAIRNAIVANNLDVIPSLLTPKQALASYLIGTVFNMTEDGVLRYGQEDVPQALANKIRELADKGEDPTGYLNFYLRLQKNPSARSVEQLFSFLVHGGHPVEANGTFLAYKGVNENLTDCHTGTVDNTPGTVHSMPRNKISDDPRTPCHYGFHVGALEYASGFGSRLIICRVDPEHVVCVPYDYSSQKMRVCEYEVVGFHVSDGNEKPLPNTTYEVDTDDDEDEDIFDGSEDDDEDTFPVDEYRELPEAPVVKSDAKKVKANNLNDLAPKDLIKESLADLRTYASKTLKIVGASKLPGGKTALLKRIAEIRGSNE